MFRLGLALAVASALVAFAARAAPLEVYGRLPTVEAVALSPNGTTLAMIVTNGDERTIIIKDVVQGKILRMLRGGNLKLRALDWAGDDHLILTLTKTGDIEGVATPRREWALVADFSLTTGKLRPMLSRVSGTLNVAVSAPKVRTIDGRPMVFIVGVQFVGSVGVQTLFRIDPATDINKTISVGGHDTRAWEVALDGTPMAQTLYDDKTGRWTLKMRVGDAWRESRVIENAENYPIVLGLGRYGHSLLVKELEDGATMLREVSPDGVWGEALPIHDVGEPIFDPARHNFIGYYALVGDEGRYTFFDPQDQKIWNAVAKAFPGQIVRPLSSSSDHSKIVVLVDSPTEGRGYALVDMAHARRRGLRANMST